MLNWLPVKKEQYLFCYHYGIYAYLVLSNKEVVGHAHKETLSWVTLQFPYFLISYFTIRLSNFN